jgi:hypothetical protein
MEIPPTEASIQGKGGEVAEVKVNIAVKKVQTSSLSSITREDP